MRLVASSLFAALLACTGSSPTPAGGGGAAVATTDAGGAVAPGSDDAGPPVAGKGAPDEAPPGGSGPVIPDGGGAAAPDAGSAPPATPGGLGPADAGATSVPDAGPPVPADAGTAAVWPFDPGDVPPGRVPVPPRTAGVTCRDGCLYVDANRGSDANDGRTIGTAFATLSRAAAAVVPGTTVLVMSGTYTSDGSSNPLTVTTSGTPDAWIVFAAAPGEHPVIRIPRGPAAYAGIYLPGVAYVAIDGFEVVGQGESIGLDEASANDGTQAVLNHNCIYVDGMGFGAFQPPVPHDIVIRNTTLHGCTAAGIEANVADALTIAYNRVYDTSWWTVFGTSGIGLMHLTDAPGSGSIAGYRNFIVGNEVYGNRNELPFRAGTPPAIYDGNGIIVDDANHAQRALGVHDVQGVPYTGRTYIANNVVHDNGGRGVHVFSSAHVAVVNNTAYDDLLSPSPAIGGGELDAEASSQVDVLNNVAVNRSGKSMNLSDGNRYDYNVWDGAKVPVVGPHDVRADPLLVDPLHGGYAPGPGSPALASGTAELAPALDFLGQVRPAGPVDRGAIQVSR